MLTFASHWLRWPKHAGTCRARNKFRPGISTWQQNKLGKDRMPTKRALPHLSPGKGWRKLEAALMAAVLPTCRDAGLL